MLSVEWSINIGTIAVLFFSIAGFYWVTKSDMRVLKDNVVAIKLDLIQLNHVVTELAVQNKRLDNQGEIIGSQGKLIATLEERVYKLSTGRGFIRNALDGEHPK